MVFSVTIIVGKKTVPGNYTVKHRSLLYAVRLFCVCVQLLHMPLIAPWGQLLFC